MGKSTEMGMYGSIPTGTGNLWHELGEEMLELLFYCVHKGGGRDGCCLLSNYIGAWGWAMVL